MTQLSIVCILSILCTIWIRRRLKATSTQIQNEQVDLTDWSWNVIFFCRNHYKESNIRFFRPFKQIYGHSYQWSVINGAIGQPPQGPQKIIHTPSPSTIPHRSSLYEISQLRPFIFCSSISKKWPERLGTPKSLKSLETALMSIAFFLNIPGDSIQYRKFFAKTLKQSWKSSPIVQLFLCMLNYYLNQKVK